MLNGNMDALGGHETPFALYESLGADIRSPYCFTQDIRHNSKLLNFSLIWTDASDYLELIFDILLQTELGTLELCSYYSKIL